MSTSEKIASVVAQFIAADREEDRERIAELERNAAILKRNLSQACKSVDELNDLVVDLNKQLDELNEECATLAVENKRLSEYASGNWGVVETPAVKQEEQGPWVVYDVDDPKWRMRDAWVYTISGEGFDSEEEAQKIIDDFGRGGKKMRVITLAEARAIEAKR